MGLPGGWELFAIVAVVLVLFGGKKIPELAKGLGKGIKGFKEEMKDDAPAEVASTEEPKKVEKAESAQETSTPSETTKQA